MAQVAALEINPRSITKVERQFIESLTRRDQADLIDALVARGQPYQRALAMAGWLAAKAEGRRDHTSQATRALYRKILAELASDASAPANLRRAIPGYLKAADQAA